MNRSRWRRRNNERMALLAVKLAEECGEVAKEVVNFKESRVKRDKYLKAMLEELDHVEFITKCLRQEAQRRLDKMNSN